MKIHPVFHSNLVRFDPDNALPDQHIQPPLPIIIDGEEEWEVERIIDSRLHRQQLQYREQWKDHPPDSTWYPVSDFLHAPELWLDFTGSTQRSFL